MSKKLLVKYITEKFRTDTGAGSLVAITGHLITDIRIARDKQPVKEKLPYLGVMVFQSIPLIGSDVTHAQKSRIYAKGYAVSELVAVDIADRVEVLLKPEKSGAVTSYYDFSGTDVSIRDTRWKSTSLPDYDDKLSVWHVLVEFDITWIA